MRGLAASYREELRRIFALRPAFSILVAAALLYAVFYPQPYLNEALRDVPIAVVDQDGTATSRALAQRVDASADIAVAEVLADVPSAEREVYARHIYGILLVPRHFERELLHGRPSPVALYADASYFLLYQRVSAGVSAVTRALGAEVETVRLIGVGVDPALAGAAADPMPTTAVPLFNPQGGYATYLLPAAFVLILQQLLLFGTGVLGTLPGRRDHATRSALAVVTGKLLAYVTLEVIVASIYLVGLPYLYGLPRLGSPEAILFFALPFVLAVGALGLIIAATFRKPLLVQLVSGAVGLPFFFLAGFAWPTEAMPEAIRLVSVLVPSTSAIDGLVRIGQLGAQLSDVRGSFLTLWVLTVVYGAIAVLMEARSRPQGHGKVRA
jgi:ABC-2 type transport system permease protein